MLFQNGRFIELSEKLGGMNQEHINSFFYVNNPFLLKHWSMNIVELLILVGAIFGLLHAINWYKTKNDPSNIAVWFSTIAYVLIIEPIIYFPEIFFLDSFFQFIFIHNEFSLGFLFNRTPLYILALYPATIYTSFIMVRALNIFERPNGLFIGAICVGFVNHCIYQIFDHIGPQNGWWLWDYDLPMSKAAMGSVPLYSLVGFAFNGAIGFAYLAKKEIVDYVEAWNWAGKKLAWKSFRVGMRTPGMIAILTPHLVYSMFFSNPNMLVVEVLYYLQLGIWVSIALFALWKADINENSNTYSYKVIDRFPIYFVLFYLATFAALWFFALNGYWKAIEGMTEGGMPIGSFSYVVVCFALCIFVIKKIYRLEKLKD